MSDPERHRPDPEGGCGGGGGGEAVAGPGRPGRPVPTVAAPGVVAPVKVAAVVIAVAALAVVVTLAWTIWRGRTPWFDAPVVSWFHDLATPWLTSAVLPLTDLGGLVLVPSITVMVALLLWWRGRRRDAAFLGVAVLGSTLLNAVLKLVFRRDRPGYWEPLAVETSSSFPSGHSVASFTLASALLVIVWGSRWGWPACALAVVYVLFVGASRIYLGVHFPSDVLAGWCVALLWVMAVRTICGRSAVGLWGSRDGRRINSTS